MTYTGSWEGGAERWILGRQRWDLAGVPKVLGWETDGAQSVYTELRTP